MHSSCLSKQYLNAFRGFRGSLSRGVAAAAKEEKKEKVELVSKQDSSANRLLQLYCCGSLLPPDTHTLRQELTIALLSVSCRTDTSSFSRFVESHYQSDCVFDL